MKSKTLFISLGCLLILVFAVVGISSCCHGNDVPLDTKYLKELHALTHEEDGINLTNDNLALFVDYSNCISNGMSSPFYQTMQSPLTAATKEYWSIRGDSITKEVGDVYTLLNNVKETNYAALDKAIAQMAEREGESVMLTDGELFVPDATKTSPTNPYMHDSFKKWLLKGHDIHIIAEPYQESYKGKTFNKKRFYIIFTDDRVEGNIYDRIKRIVNLENYPQVNEYHLSGNYPWVIPTNGKNSDLNKTIAANINGYGDYEIQDWQLDWENIFNLVVNGVDENGNPLTNGEKLIGGLRINRNAYGSYRINDIEVKVTNINDDYNNLYNRLEFGEKVKSVEANNVPLDKFIIVDHEEFKKHGNVELYFDTQNFAPEGDLEGKPYNYFKIEIYVKDLENILGNNIGMFNFDSITQEGQTNVSISESLKNCVYDPQIIKKIKEKPLYTIYVKSEKFK